MKRHIPGMHDRELDNDQATGLGWTWTHASSMMLLRLIYTEIGQTCQDPQPLLPQHGWHTWTDIKSEDRA